MGLTSATKLPPKARLNRKPPRTGGCRTLSQTISQGEYSKLFERNRLGVVSQTEYLSRGAWYENGAQFGIFGNSSYALEALYRDDPGQRLNNDFYERELRLHLKQQLTPNDSVYLRLVHYESEGGDRFQYYDPASANLGLRTKETQEPTLTLGYHHQWNPGSHFLVTAARFDDTYEEANPFLKFLLRGQAFDQLLYVRDLDVLWICALRLNCTLWRHSKSGKVSKMDGGGRTFSERSF